MSGHDANPTFINKKSIDWMSRTPFTSYVQYHLIFPLPLPPQSGCHMSITSYIIGLSCNSPSYFWDIILHLYLPEFCVVFIKFISET